MVLVDDRVGSRELADPLRRLGTVLEVCRLDYGDVGVYGRGPAGGLDVGIERKTVGDLLSSLGSGRLAGHQIPGLVEQYDVVVLVVEGPWRPTAGGEIEVPIGGRRWGPPHAGRWTWGSVWRALLSMMLQAGIHVVPLPSMRATCQLVHTLDRWVETPWEDHTTLKALGSSTLPKSEGIVTASDLRRFWAGVPEVGWVWSREAERRFGTPREGVEAGVEAWAELRPFGTTKAGRRRARLGTKRAERIVRFLHGQARTSGE